MKMKVIESTKTTTYEIKGSGGFMVDIVDHGAQFEAFLYHCDYGIKELMFGCPKTQCIHGVNLYMSFNEFKEMVLSNLKSEKYIQFYVDEYMD